jgi:hypothetical protein
MLEAAINIENYQAENLHFQSAFAFLDSQVNPNFNGSNPEEAYMKCALVMFASVRRFHPNATLTFVTNKPLPQKWLERFSAIHCDNRVLPFEFKAPEAFISSFQGSLFLLDLLSNLEGSKLNIILDPDVICVSHLPEDFSLTIGDRIGVLEIESHPTQDINGLSPSEQREYQVANGHPKPHLNHFGGEIYVIPSSRLAWVKKEIYLVWNQNKENFLSGQMHLITEEHILNFVFGKTQTTNLSEIISRIWTATRYRSVPSNVSDLCLWHLPAEKGYGFEKIFNVLEDPESWFNLASGTMFRHMAAKSMSIHGWPALLKARRVLSRIRYKF